MTDAATAGSTQDAGRITVDFWGDVGCPWCYIGKKRLEDAVTASGNSESVDIVLHSFELAPGMSTDAIPMAEFLAGVMHSTVAQARQRDEQVAKMALSEGLEYSTERVQSNTFDAHRIFQLAQAHGRGREVFGILQRELFSGRENVYTHETLRRLAVDTGLPEAEVDAVLAGDAYADAVRADVEQARRLGVTGVPFVVVDGRYAVPGGATTDGYLQAIRTAQREAA